MQASTLTALLLLLVRCSRFKRVYTPLGLEKLQHWIDTGRLDATQTITLKEIFDSGIVGKFKHGVALVGNVRPAAC